LGAAIPLGFPVAGGLHRILRTKIHDLQVQLMKQDPSEATQSKVFNGSIPKLMSGRRVTG
jgi:hypothetical protein